MTSPDPLFPSTGSSRPFAPLLQHGGASKAILFGSYARGEADGCSDLDLAIIAETEKPFLDRYQDPWDLLLAWPRGMDLLVYTPEEFERMQAEGNPFIERVVEEGVVIYER